MLHLQRAGAVRRVVQIGVVATGPTGAVVVEPALVVDDAGPEVATALAGAATPDATTSERSAPRHDLTGVAPPVGAGSEGRRGPGWPRLAALLGR
ncbi:hypothetical protein GCM10025868_18290 [Angustibacter aerolatus]|uniref:Uncharacterized protein n=1 Tax=Angustibacter aerolatus TaxID=1162965 RepID=A0ABQ6JFJ9_9ACTN|nr:hypothetical protein GCM10025868_18290 [Angustibacter aerolatus]